MMRHFSTKVVIYYAFSLHIILSSGQNLQELERRLSAVESRLTTINAECPCETKALKRRLSAVESRQNTSRAETHALELRLNTSLAVKQRVAFLAQFSSTDLTSPASGPYKFDHVAFNDGDHYDRTTGIFTAPVAGVYLFTAQFFMYKKRQAYSPRIDLVVNGEVRLRMGITSVPEQSSCTALTLRLVQGDRVWVETLQRSNWYYFFWGSVHTFFSGALLYAP